MNLEELLNDDRPAKLFKSLSTNAQDVWSDFTEYLLGERKRRGTVTPATGVTKPVDRENANSQEKLVLLEAEWDADNYEQKQGTSRDEIGAPIGMNYAQHRRAFIEESEGRRKIVYKDHKGNRTVGIGFNMESDSARAVWKRAFGDGGLDFNKVRSGKVALNDTQIEKLFDASVQDAESLVSNRFSGTRLTTHQRLALVSMAFNNPNLIGENLTKYVRGGDLNAAAREILYKSNKNKHKGIANRRYREATMFVGHGSASQVLPDFKEYQEHLFKS